jgi:hypothetical protein
MDALHVGLQQTNRQQRWTNLVSVVRFVVVMSFQVNVESPKSQVTTARSEEAVETMALFKPRLAFHCHGDQHDPGWRFGSPSLYRMPLIPGQGDYCRSGLHGKQEFKGWLLDGVSSV